VSTGRVDRSVEVMTKSTGAAEAARRYLARGWSVLPLRERDKRALILWEHLQNERPLRATPASAGGLTWNRAGLAQGIDLRGDGSYIVAPPSIHPSGRSYKWVPGHRPDEITLAPSTP
jgi:hypothetical protein